jgi:prophage regulatory protein
METLMDVTDRIVLEPERKILTGVGRSKWYELESAGLAPARRQVVGRRTGWLLLELLAWVKARPVAKGEPPAAALAARGIVKAGA